MLIAMGVSESAITIVLRLTQSLLKSLAMEDPVHTTQAPGMRVPTQNVVNMVAVEAAAAAPVV